MYSKTGWYLIDEDLRAHCLGSVRRVGKAGRPRCRWIATLNNGNGREFKTLRAAKTFIESGGRDG